MTEPYDNGYTTHGWSMTVADLRAALADLPDDTEVVIDSGDCEIRELHLTHLFPGTPMGQVGLVTITDGQTISSEYNYHDRLDAGLDYGLVHWDSTTKKWKDRS